MIVWLASYPRSGNTLLRTVLWQTMGLQSTSDVDKRRQPLDEETRRLFGGFERSQPWDIFYPAAQTSPEVALVKTHLPPRDDYPAIYVVRDGRKSCLSYAHFHETHSGNPHPSLMDIVLGDDFYGDWSSHFHCWHARRNTLLVRYEELVNASAELLVALAAHIGYRGSIQPWRNPFAELNQSHPDFFRQGMIEWQNDPKWPAWINSLFFQLHGELMIALGYVSPESASAACADIPAEFLPLLAKCESLIAEKRNLSQVCSERLQVIEGLKQACDERLTLIEKLHEQAAAANSRLYLSANKATFEGESGK